MDILYLLIPASVLLVFCILGVFAWALQDGQFDELGPTQASFDDTTSAGFDACQAP
jgi:cbb3-type cytochrome oxidase maturation protein